MKGLLYVFPNQLVQPTIQLSDGTQREEFMHIVTVPLPPWAFLPTSTADYKYALYQNKGRQTRRGKGSDVKGYWHFTWTFSFVWCDCEIPKCVAAVLWDTKQTPTPRGQCGVNMGFVKTSTARLFSFSSRFARYERHRRRSFSDPFEMFSKRWQPTDL